MPKIKFSDLDPTAKRAVFWLADQAGTLTPTIRAAAAHVGELWEAVAFMQEHPEGTAAHATLAERLRLGTGSDESILDCIERAAPTYRSVGDRVDAELDELLASLENASVFV